jgi:serine/threonine-protein kinase
MPQTLRNTTVAIGDLIADKYQVERVIGEGGMGVVVAARHLELDERVAIKFLLPEALTNAEAVARFAREARAAVKIKSEHVARTYDVGRLDTGAPYMVMEYLEGTDLAKRLRATGPLPIQQAVTFMLEACEALADAHAIGIIHRDLKPSNLYIVRKSDASESVKLLDFGISKVTSEVLLGHTPEITRTAAIMGSPSYMSPEQLTSTRDVDVRSDIWSLGVTLFELLTGVQPFSANNLAELGAKVLAHPTPSLRSRRPEIPPELEAVVGQCLNKRPGDRYANVAELASALAPFGSWRAWDSAERIARVLCVSVSTKTKMEVAAPSDALITTAAELLPATTDSDLVGTTSVSSEATAAALAKSTSRSRRNKVLISTVIAAAALIVVTAYTFKTLMRSQPVTEFTALTQGVPSGTNATEVVASSRPVSGSAGPVDRVPPIDIRSLPPVVESPPAVASARAVAQLPRKKAKADSSAAQAPIAPAVLASATAPASAKPASSERPAKGLPEYGGRKY